MIDIPVTELIPQQDRMMFLDHIIAFEEGQIKAYVEVKANGLFDDGQTIPAWIGIEYMAQTVAAHSGMLSYLAQEPLKPGLLLGARKFHTNVAKLPIGIGLTVTVERIIEDQQLAVFNGDISGPEVQMSAQINVYQARTLQPNFFSSLLNHA
jgi:predicted hotdog family 3-hydroxylacyl-ACP dehydratase